MSAAAITMILTQILSAIGAAQWLLDLVPRLVAAVPPSVWGTIDAWAQTEGEAAALAILRDSPHLAGVLWRALVSHGREIGAPDVLPAEIPWGLSQPGPSPQIGFPVGDPLGD